MTERPSTSSEPPRRGLWRATAIGAIAVGLIACGHGGMGAKGNPDFAGPGGSAGDAQQSSDGSTTSGGSGGHIENGRAGSDGNAGSSGGSTDSGSAAVLDASPWDPGVTPLPTLCVQSFFPIASLGIWADDRGPYVLLTDSNGTNLLHLNHGAWSSLWTQLSGSTYGDVFGFPNHGDFLISSGYSCPMQRLHAGATTCEVPNAYGHVAIVSATLAYAISHDRVLLYDGLGWTQYQNALGTKPLEVLTWDVWASNDVVGVTSVEGRVFISKANTPFVERLDLGSDTYRVIWGLGTRLWIGGRGGTLRLLDGDQLTTRKTVIDACSTGIRGLWGTGDTLYIHTEHGVYRFDEAGLTTLHEYPCDQTVTSFWGVPAAAQDSGAPGATTLYVAVKRENVSTPACGLVQIDVF